jgi:hypothetical protein
MKTVILTIILMVSSVAFANDDDIFWGYCEDNCDRIVSNYTVGNGNCYVVKECKVVEWNEDTNECEETKRVTIQTSYYYCPAPPPMPPMPPLPY